MYQDLLVRFLLDFAIKRRCFISYFQKRLAFNGRPELRQYDVKKSILGVPPDRILIRTI